MKQLLSTLAGLCLLVGVRAQGPQIALCNTYQTTQAFDQAFISKVQANEEGYSFLLTSGPNFGCKKITFFPNGTYFYDFVDETNNHSSASGPYRMKPFSYIAPASIEMSALPFGELGSVLGSVSFNVLQAEADLLVLLSCVNIGLIRSQQLHVLIPEAKISSISAKEVNTTVQELQVPLAGFLEEVQQTCAPSSRQLFLLSWLKQLLYKLGIYLPFYRSQNDDSFESLLHAALANPSIHLPENNELVPPSFWQEAGLFSGHGSPPSPAVPSLVYPQPATVTGFKQPYLVGQQVVPQVPAGVQFGFQQFQGPTDGYLKVPTPAASFGGQSSQFFGAPLGSPLNFVSRKDQPNSVPFFLANKPAQTPQVGEGLYSAFYHG